MSAGEISTIGNLERAKPGLVRALRLRGLIDHLCTRTGVCRKRTWIGMTFQEAVQFVKENKFRSSTDFHQRAPGAWKYARSEGWIGAISLEMRWGQYADITGRGWQSVGEMIVANILLAAVIDFIPHEKLPGFFGRKGGQCFSDFYLRQYNVWVEVWGYFADFEERENYNENRKHKEAQYEQRDLNLCSIEGSIIYRSQLVNGKTYTRGVSSFEAHAIARLIQCGVLMPS